MDIQKVAVLLLCVALYLVLISLVYPIILFVSLIYAIYLRIFKGKVSDILKHGGRIFPNKKIPYELSFHYAAMIVFKKPFSNKQKAQDILIAMAKCCEISQDKVAIIFEDTTPTNVFPNLASIDTDYYIVRGSIFIKEADQYKCFILYIRIWNGRKDDEPTVVMFNGAAGTWDGSSNFNFIREFTNRYWLDIENQDFFQGDKLNFNKTSKQIVDQKNSFFLFLCRMPYNLFWNCSSMFWQLIKAAKWSGGPGISMEVTLLNFNQEDSELLTQGAKIKRVKPFAAMTYAAVKAYRQILQSNPHAIIQQSSLMTRHYNTNGQGFQMKGRNYVGDWLIGPLQFIDNRSYTLEQAENNYQQLIAGLDTLNSQEVIYAMEAKAWGWLQGSSGVFEVLPSYNDASIVFDSIFFNNYGTRDIANLTSAITGIAKALESEQIITSGNSHNNENATSTSSTVITTTTDNYVDNSAGGNIDNGSINNNTTATTTHSPVVSWNWSAPFRLGFNTIHINGKTCITLASCVVGLSKLNDVRDCVAEILYTEFIQVARERNNKDKDKNNKKDE